MTWREKAAPLIWRIIEEHGHKGVKELARQLKLQYPWGERSGHPYHAWRDEIRRQIFWGRPDSKKLPPDVRRQGLSLPKLLEVRKKWMPPATPDQLRIPELWGKQGRGAGSLLRSLLLPCQWISKTLRPIQRLSVALRGIGSFLAQIWGSATMHEEELREIEALAIPEMPDSYREFLHKLQKADWQAVLSAGMVAGRAGIMLDADTQVEAAQRLIESGLHGDELREALIKEHMRDQHQQKEEPDGCKDHQGNLSGSNHNPTGGCGGDAGQSCRAVQAGL